MSKYDCSIEQIRERGDRDFWATLYGSGLTFTEDIERFARYCDYVEALDISKELQPRFGHEHRYYTSSRAQKSDYCLVCGFNPKQSDATTEPRSAQSGMVDIHKDTTI